MSDKEIVERVREDIGKELVGLCAGQGDAIYRLITDKILSHKNIAIIDPDQTLDSFLKIVGKRYPEFLDIIIKEGWVKGVRVAD